MYNLLLEVVSKNAGLVENWLDADGTPHSVESLLGLHCLIRPVCPNTYGKYIKIAGLMENKLDADEMRHSAESHLGQHGLLRPVCLDIYWTDGTATDFACEVLPT